MRLTRRPDPHVRRWQLAWLTFAGLLAGIFALAYVGRIPRIIALLPHYDIWGHLVLYGLLAYLTHRGLQRASLQRSALTLPLALPSVFTLAAVEELLQGLAPLRSASWRDLAADLAGMLIALGVDVLWLRLHQERAAAMLGAIDPLERADP